MNSDGALTNAFMSTETDVCLPSTAPPAIPATSVITEQFNRSNPQFTVLLRNSILNEVLLQLPLKSIWHKMKGGSMKPI